MFATYKLKNNPMHSKSIEFDTELQQLAHAAKLLSTFGREKDLYFGRYCQRTAVEQGNRQPALAGIKKR
jgi:hypothetical protein